MIIRFLFLLSFASSFFFLNKVMAEVSDPINQTLCYYEGAVFSNCSRVYGNPVNITNWNTSNGRAAFSKGSAVYFINHRLLNVTSFDIIEDSYVFLELASTNTSNILVNLYDCAFTYKGASKGRVDIKAIDLQLENYMYTISSVGDISTIENSRGKPNVNFTVGIINKDGTHEVGNITVGEIIGNLTSVNILEDSKLTINKFTNTSDNIGIKNLYAEGEIVFNDSTTIDSIHSAGVITVNGNKVIKINNIGNYNSGDTGVIREINLAKGSSLYLLDKSNTKNTNIINKIQGEGTLRIEPNYKSGDIKTPFRVQDINILTLYLEDGTLVIENNTPYYTNARTDKNIIRKINLVTKQASMPGGELVVNGTLILDHIYDLKKLTLCGTDALLSCNNNANLTVIKESFLRELVVNDGKLNINLTKDNLKTVALSADNIIFKSGILESIVNDTNIITPNNPATYYVLSASDASNLSINVPLDSFTTSLPDWYQYNYYLSEDGKSLMLNAKRKGDGGEGPDPENPGGDPGDPGTGNPNPDPKPNPKEYSYQWMVLQSKYKESKPTVAMAAYMDYIIDNEIPLEISGKTITYVDMLSNNNYDDLAFNINSLIPLSQDKYLKSAHFSLKEALNTSKSIDGQKAKKYNKRSNLRFPSRTNSVSNDNGGFWFSVSGSSGGI